MHAYGIHTFMLHAQHNSCFPHAPDNHRKGKRRRITSRNRVDNKAVQVTQDRPLHHQLGHCQSAILSNHKHCRTQYIVHKWLAVCTSHQVCHSFQSTVLLHTFSCHINNKAVTYDADSGSESEPASPSHEPHTASAAMAGRAAAAQAAESPAPPAAAAASTVEREDWMTKSFPKAAANADNVPLPGAKPVEKKVECTNSSVFTQFWEFVTNIQAPWYQLMQCRRMLESHVA